MVAVIKFLFFILFAAAIFGRSYIESELLYWSIYLAIGVLLVILWFVKYWFSKKKLSEFLGKDPSFQIFAGRVPSNVQDDLDRGRFCVSEDKLLLIIRDKKKYSVVWESEIKNLSSISFGKVLNNHRRGFTVNHSNGSTEFTCASISKHKEELCKAIGWK